MSQAEWLIVESIPRGSGKTDHHLNVRCKGGRVRVVERVGGGPRFVCMACVANDCEHTRFVAGVIARGELPADHAPPHTDDDFIDHDDADG